MAMLLAVCAHGLLRDASAQGLRPANVQGVPPTRVNRPFEWQQPAGVGDFAQTDFAQTDVVVGPANQFATPQTQCDWPKWYVSAETLFLWRDNHYPASSVDDSNYAMSLLGDFDVGVGPRVMAGLRPDENWELQALYFGVFGMDARWSGTSNGLSSQLDLTSQLNNVEVNLFRTWDQFSLLAGFRYVGLNDDFDWRSSRQDVSPDLFSMQYRTSAENNLFGGQLGLRWRRESETVFFEAIGKAGVFGNNACADGFVSVIDPQRPEPTAVFPQVQGYATSFVGELNFNSGIHLSRTWSLRGGYNLLWITHVAMAPDRVIFDWDPYAPVYTERQVFLHGANVGLEAVW